MGDKLGRALRLYIDAGHGGNDPGVVGPGGLKESALTVDVAGRLAAMAMASGWDVQLSRSGSEGMSLASRAVAANTWGADLFVSIHGNGAANDRARGFEVWTSPGQTGSDEVAEVLAETWRDSFPVDVMRCDMTDGDLDKESPFYVLVHTRCRAVLVEVGFVSNPESEKLLATAIHRAAIARALCDGLNAWRDSR